MNTEIDTICQGVGSNANAKPVLLFVHGAWFDSSSWAQVTSQLSGTDWQVRTVDLPSVAAIGGPRFGLHDDADAVRRAIKEIDGPVVVVAHSYGGAVATEGAAGLHNVRHIVYIAGFQLDIGESLIGLTGNQNPDWWNVDGDTMLPDRPHELFFNDLPRSQSERVGGTLKPFSISAVSEMLTAAVWHNVPSTYLLCERDNALPLPAQETMAARATHIRRLPSGHLPFLSMPAELTRLIVEAATADAAATRHHRRTAQGDRTRAELVASARDLQPLLRKHVADGEVYRRQADEVVEALTTAGMFRLFTPRRFGGYSTSLRTLVDVTEALAEADGSAAWVVGIAAGGAWLAAHATERAQEEVFGPTPDVRISGSSKPAPARRVDGGLRLDGRWAYASGSPHSSWAGVAAAVADEHGQPLGAYFALVPRSDLSLEDTWQTVGMRGTGSNTWVGDDLFVPEHRLFATAGVADGSPRHDESLYRLPFGPFAAVSLMGTLLGLGRAALDYTIEMAPTKPLQNTFFARQSESVAIQVQTAEAALKLQTARLHTHRIADDLGVAAINGGVLAYADRAHIRAQVGYAVGQVLEAIQILLNVHGAAGFTEASPLQQIWRDANTGGRHAGFNTAIVYEVFGKVLLGVPERISAMV